MTRLRLPPFIVTLGTLNVFFAINLCISQSETIRGTDMSVLLLWTGNTFNFGDTRITYGTILMLALFAVFAWVLKNTAWGKHVYAVGDDAEAARLAGVRKDRVLLSVYVVARPDLRRRGLDADRPHRVGLPAGRRHRPTSTRSPRS